MTRNRRKRQIAIRLALLAAVLSVVFSALIIPAWLREDIRAYFGLSGSSEVGITVDFEKSETTGRIINGKVYLDYDSVTRYVNPSVYYDEAAKLLITTTPYAKTELSLESGSSPDQEAGFLDGILYIALDYLENVSDIAAVTREDPHYVHIDTESVYTEASFTKKTPVKVVPGTFKKTIDVIPRGARARIRLPEDGDRWMKVITENGLVGYVKTGAAGKETEEVSSGCGTDPQKIYTKHLMEERVNLVFHQTDNQASNNALSESLEGVRGVNVIAPTWFYLDSTDGSVRDVTSVSYVEYAHEAGMQVWAAFNDFDGYVSSPSDTASFLGSYAARTAAAGAVTEAVAKCGADGLIMDFELVRNACSAEYLEFLRELAVNMRNEGKVFAVCNYVPKYTTWMMRGEQARIADYIITMCYDEHTVGSEEAGSVSSLPFVEKGLKDTLLEVPPEQLIAALPFFTRLWTTTGNAAPESAAYGMKSAREKAEEYGMTAVWDEKTGQNYAELSEGEVLRQIWFEDQDSIELKLECADALNTAGYAWWKLGLETKDIWGVIADRQ